MSVQDLGYVMHPAASKSILTMDSVISVGFGIAQLTKDNNVLFDDNGNLDEPMRVSEAEALAAKDPKHDWRIVLYAPLQGATYQRQGPEQWVCIEYNKGFA